MKTSEQVELKNPRTKTEIHNVKVKNQNTAFTSKIVRRANVDKYEESEDSLLYDSEEEIKKDAMKKDEGYCICMMITVGDKLVQLTGMSKQSPDYIAKQFC